MNLRPLEPDDISAAADLLRRAALEFILHESTLDGARDFLGRHGEDGLRANLAAGFVYHVAVVDGALAGFAGMRERSHLFHLFVDRRFQRRGIARRLWETARDSALDAALDAAPGPGHPGVFTVNASNYAVPFYEALGFVRSAPMQSGAVHYNPMRLQLGSRFVAPA